MCVCVRVFVCCCRPSSVLFPLKLLLVLPPGAEGAGIDVLAVLSRRVPCAAVVASVAAVAAEEAALLALPPDDDEGELPRPAAAAAAAGPRTFEPELERDHVALLDAVGGADGVPALPEPPLLCFICRGKGKKE